MSQRCFHDHRSRSTTSLRIADKKVEFLVAIARLRSFERGSELFFLSLFSSSLEWAVKSLVGITGKGTSAYPDQTLLPGTHITAAHACNILG